MGGVNWTIVSPLVSWLIGAAVCTIIYVKSARLDSWFVATRGRRLSILIATIATASLVGILVCLPSWSEIAQLNGTVRDNVLFSAILVLISIAILGEAIQFRQADCIEEQRKELEDRATRAEKIANEAKAEEFFYRWVSICFLKAVGEKADRFQSAANNGSIRRLDQAHRLEKLRHVADPDQQIKSLVQIVYQIYHHLLMQVNNRAKLRVAYLRIRGKGLQVRYAWDGTNQTFIKSLPTKAKVHFRMSGESQCCATAAAKDGQVLIVSNTAEAALDPMHPFRYCHETQSHYLRSLLVLPVREPDGKDFSGHVICVDTDEVGFFRDEMRDQHEFVREQLAKRLLVELGVERLMNGAN